MARKKGKNPDANYDFPGAKTPIPREGKNAFAGMPDGAMMMAFPHKPQYRDGIVNGFVADLDQMSKIEENQC